MRSTKPSPDHSHIPPGSTYDERGNELTHKDSGYWRERTYDERDNVLTHKDSNGYSCERTHDERGNVLTHKNSNGDSYERTYDERGNELTHTDHTGHWVTLAADASYTLRHNAQTGTYWAGCRKLTHNDALAHWNPETSESPRAALFHAAITNHTTNHEAG